jgi:6,7-dimethyl-8-ribityllumazine synthase
LTEEFPKSWPDRSAENVLAPDPVPAPEPVPDPPAPPEAAAAPEPLPVPGPEPEPEVEAVALPEPVEAEAVPEAEPEPQAEDEDDAEDTPAPALAPVAEHAPGELAIPDEVGVLEGEAGPTKRLVAIVVGKFNADITTRMLESAIEALDGIGVPRAQVTVVPVPGAFELPLAAMALAKTRRYICVVALGCVIRGETPHFDFVASEAASGLQLAGLETGVPVSFGVLTCDNAEQAETRIGKGADAVRAALEMADLFSQLRQTASGG